MKLDELVPVFSPVDVDLKWKFGGEYFVLAANDITPVPAKAVPVLLTQLGELGVTNVPRGVSKEEVNRIIFKAETTFWNNKHKQNEALVLTQAEQDAKRRAANLPVPEESDEIKQARKWLAEHQNPPQLADIPKPKE